MTKNINAVPGDSLDVLGRIVVTDPCYLVPRDLWDDLCRQWFNDKPGEDFDPTLSDQCVIEYDGARILMSHTAYGDGTYRVRGAEGEFGVDSGCMCVAHVDDLTRLGWEKPSNGLAVYLTANGTVFSDGRGQFGGAVSVSTLDEDEDEDEEE